MPGREPESSPAVSETATIAETATVQSDVSIAADSSSAQTDGGMLEAVSAAITPKAEASSSSDGQDTKSETDPNAPTEETADGEGEDAEFTDEEISRLHSKTRKQFKKLLADRSGLRTELESTRPKAEQFDKIVKFTRDAGMSGDEVNRLFEIGANMKRNPQKALEQLRPYYDLLLAAAGDTLPDDLKDQVAKGYLTEAHARELSRTRVTAATANAEVQRRAERENQEREQGQRANHVTAVQTAVSNWENSQAKADPDWKFKQQRVMDAVKLHILEKGYPKTVEDGVKIAQDALAAVNEDLRRTSPRREAHTPVTDTAATRSKPAPKNIFDAVSQAVG